jgi:hypothetical protein
VRRNLLAIASGLSSGTVKFYLAYVGGFSSAYPSIYLVQLLLGTANWFSLAIATGFFVQLLLPTATAYSVQLLLLAS